MRHQPIRMGMVGGGPGAFIGPVHRRAAELDGAIRLVAGAFSSSPARSREAGQGYGIDPARAYASLDDLLAGEAGRPDGIEMLVVATPNHLHLEAAARALEAGLAVMSDKPATATYDEALTLRDVVARTAGVYGLTFTYTGYAMVREARALVAAGAIGPVRRVDVRYLQGWLAHPVERAGNKQAAWRIDPSAAGPGGCIGDIGVHAFNLAEFVAGVPVSEINPTLRAAVPGRRIDDDATVLLRFANGASGSLLASQVAAGERNNLSVQVYGERGGIAWSHEAPDVLKLMSGDGAVQLRYAGSEGLSDAAHRASRLPAGHPEGYVSAFANLYRDFVDRIRGDGAPMLPGIEEGVRAMGFVKSAVDGNDRGWTKLAA